MDAATRKKMQGLVGEAIGIWSKPPGEGEGPSHDEEELEDLKKDLDILHSVWPELKKLGASIPKNKILREVEAMMKVWDREADALEKKLR